MGGWEIHFECSEVKSEQSMGPHLTFLGQSHIKTVVKDEPSSRNTRESSAAYSSLHSSSEKHYDKSKAR